jgi:ribokinase
VDTVGAGDAFAGTFVARRAEGSDLITAVRAANAAGALATLKRGAQESIPTRASILKFELMNQ